MSFEIAVLLTVYNRKQKTISCLEHLFSALDSYNAGHEGGDCVCVVVFMTDDGCTDGTAEAVRESFANREINIIQGTGSLYWAGGMRYAWNEALKQHQKWNFYLLLNDDTNVMENVFQELLSTHFYAIKEFRKAGIYSGITCDTEDHSLITYGGDVYLSAAKGKWDRLGPSDHPRLVDKTNANILLVSHDVVDKVGIFYEGYIHSGADEDYGIIVRKAGLPALVTANICGTCPYDHTDDVDVCEQLTKMSLAERRKFVRNPLHRDHDHLLLVRRHTPQKYLISWTLRKIRCYFPSLYMKINKARGVYK